MVKKKASLLRDLYVKRKDLVLPFFENTLLSVNSSLSQTLYYLLKNREYLEIVSAQCSPLDYSCAETFRSDYLVCEMMSKFPHWDIGVDRDKVAIGKFEASEGQCAETNRKLSRPSTWSADATAVIHTATRKIERLLGPFDWNEAAKYFAFGPGSTTRLKRTHADAYFKLKGKPESTLNNLVPSITALRYFNTWGEHIGGPDLDRVSLVAGNKVVTVPKNAKTNRVIAIEPCMNIFIQKGIGGVIRRRLRRVGVDLDDQEPNQQYAYTGSVDGSLATLDLSAASDTIAKRLVEELLPPDWYEALSSCRSESGVLPSGKSIYYQKFSSMGNGYTFELESLIFWAVCSAVIELTGEKDQRLAVYGDDLIIPTGSFKPVCVALEFCGFTVNAKKTHSDGPFRESCGKHYFRGVDVTPIYIKDNVASYPRYIWLANQTKRWSRHVVWGLTGPLQRGYELIRSNMKGYWSHPHIPDGIGDGALIGDFDEVCPKSAANGWFGLIACFFTEKRESYDPDDPPLMLKSLYRLEQKLRSGEPSRSVFIKSKRDSGKPLPLGVLGLKAKYAYAKRAVWQWPSFGPWQG